MWFVNFVLCAAVLVTSLVLGWATYLERLASTAAVIQQVQIPLPAPRPKLAARDRAQQSQEQDAVIVPKPTPVSHKKSATHRRERRINTW
jgi:hypothetical protein